MRLPDFIKRGASQVEQDEAIYQAQNRQSELRDEMLRATMERFWEELDPSIKERAIAILRRELGGQMDDMAKRLLARGDEWYVPYHHGWGTKVRNVLRRGGIKDEELPAGTAGPDGNWDDYYGHALNAAIREHCEEPILREEAEERRVWNEMLGRG